MNEMHGDPGNDLSLESPHASDREWIDALLSHRLPHPRRQRWQPLRAGLVNLFYFEDERFPFADGRLLLRGVNASGKSRVLAFLLPFLFDAQLSPHRLEPDRDGNRQIAWNLLMNEHHDRVGYSWLEFGRVDPVNGPQFLTLGCGLKAIEGRGITEHWFFVTSRRIDRDLALVSPQRIALTRRQLVEALADEGQVFERAAEYRRVVDEKLFRLGDRYDDLMELLLSLRQPQLAKKLDIEQLQSALRESLPPLSRRLLATAANAFRDLETDRQGLRTAQQAHARTEEFLIPYREHVRMGLQRAGESVRQTNSGYETARSEMRELERQIADGRQQVQRQEKALRQADEDAVAEEAALGALRQSDAARSVERLEEKRKNVEAARQDVNRWEDASARSAEQARREALSLESAETRFVQTRERASRQAAAAATMAAPDALAQSHRIRLAALVEQKPCPREEVVAALGALKDETKRWRRGGEHLLSIIQKIDEQRGRWKERRADLNRREDELLARQEATSEAGQRLASACEAQWKNFADWFQSAHELFEAPSLLESLEPRWNAWIERMEGDDPLLVAAQERHRQKTTAIAESIADLEHRRGLLRVEVASIEEELRRLEAGEELLPPVPATRSPSARVDRPGAPFWKLIDFASTVPAAEHAGWEAALQSSGLLDAWVDPAGRLENAEQDAFLTVDGEALQLERQLARVLVPLNAESADRVPRAMLAAVLERIGVGAGAGRIWVDRDGKWKNGPLYGHAAKEDAEFIGPEARRRHRERRLRLLAEKRTSAEREDARLMLDLEKCHRRQTQLDEQRRSIPSTEPLRRALAERETRERFEAEACEARQRAAQLEQQEQERLRRLVESRDQDANDLGLSLWAERPRELLDQLDGYLRSLDSLARDAEDLHRAAEEEAEKQAALERCESTRLADEKSLHAARQELKRRESEWQTLEETLGAEAGDIARRIEECESRFREAKKRRDESRERGAEAKATLKVRSELLDSKEEVIQERDEERRAAVERLERLAGHGLFETAAYGFSPPAAPWSLTQGIETARQLHRAAGAFDYSPEAWSRSQTRIHERNETLRLHLDSYHVSIETEFLEEGLQLVRGAVGGAILRIDQIARHLHDEVASREQVLSEKEREIFEKFLLGEVGMELHQKMQDAQEQVERMNREVASRPMSTGMEMRFRWELAEDAGPELRAARDILVRMTETWSKEDGITLTTFLQKRIQVEQSQDAAATWQMYLEAALDYRRWHALRIERRPGPGKDWQPLTPRSYAALSGGEKAIALTVPQCAAAAAYYGSADPLAPRFILLDEAFAGVSTDNRSSCLELLVSFDLDVIMTSENERGCYSTVPGLAICRLSREADLPAVLNDVSIWNGKRLFEAAAAPPLEGADRSIPQGERPADGRLF